MVWFDIGWILYPVLFSLLFIIGFILFGRNHVYYLLTYFLLLIVFWIIMYFVLSFLKTKGWFPEIIILGNCIGGCV